MTHRLDRVRAISIRQPWIEAIVIGAKDVENRAHGFPKSYRGLVLLHAPARWSERARHDDRVRGAFPVGSSTGYALRHEVAYAERPPHPFVSRAIVGTAHVDDIHVEHGGCCEPWGETSYPDSRGVRRTGVTHICLSAARRLAHPVECNGALGLWRPHDRVLNELADQGVRR